MPPAGIDLELQQSLNNLEKLFTITPSEEPIVFTKYLEEHRDRLINILSDETSYNLIAPMSGGKTTTLLKLADKNKIKTIMLVPYVSLAMQKAKDFKKKYDIVLGCVHGGDNENKIESTPRSEIIANIRNENPIISVYDSLSRIIDLIEDVSGKENPPKDYPLKDYILIIDESHNLVTQSDFRLAAIYRILSAQEKFRKVIYLTGTPECTLLNKFSTIQFVKNTPPPPATIHLINYSNKGLHKIFNHLMGVGITGKVIVAIDDIKKLDVLKKLLIKFKRIDEKCISIISSKDKTEDAYVTILEEELIPNDVQYLLTTRIISDGINIFDDNVQHLYFLNMKDYWLKRQFISRFRKGVENVYDFNNSGITIPLKIDSYEDSFKDILVLQQLFRDGIQNLYLAGKPWINKIANSSLNSPKWNGRNDIIYFDESAKEFKVIHQKIGLLLLDKINDSIHSNTVMALCFYSKICRYDVMEIFTYNNLVEFDVIKEVLNEHDFAIEQKKVNMVIDYENFDSLLCYFREIMTTAVNKADKSKYFDKLNPTGSLIVNYENEEQDDFYSKHKMIFDRLKKTLVYITEFLIQNYPPEFAEYLLRLGYDGKYNDINKLNVILSAFADYNIISEIPPIIEAPFINDKIFSDLKLVHTFMERCRRKDKVSLNELHLLFEELKKGRILEKGISFQQFSNKFKGVFGNSKKRSQKTKDGKAGRDYYFTINNNNSIKDLLNEEFDLPPDVKELIINNWEYICFARFRYYMNQFILNPQTPETYKEDAKYLLDVISTANRRLSRSN